MYSLEADNTDTSDEEEVRNTLGNVPLEWYEDYCHLGYDVEGHKLPKPSSAASDEVVFVCLLTILYASVLFLCVFMTACDWIMCEMCLPIL